MKKIIISILSICAVFMLASCQKLFGDNSQASSGVESSSANSANSEEQDVKVTVTFKQSGREDIVKTLEKGASLTDIPTPAEKIGYTVVWENVDYTNITENMTVNAVETANQYSVTYDTNGGILENLTQEVTFDAVTTLAEPTREDYLFNGWTYEGKAVVSGAKWAIASDVTLVAEWIDNRPSYTVTFVDGTNETSVAVKKGEDVAVADIPAFVGKTGYSATWDIMEYTNIQTDVTVTAVYTANVYTITYDADGFSLDGTTVQLEYDALCTALDMSLTQDGAIFLGWKYEEATYTNTSVWNIADNVALTAEWETKDQVTVSFMDSDGSTINKTVYKGQDLIDIPTPKAKTGYTVDDVWYSDEECTQIAAFTNVENSCVVYAKVTANDYAISYNANGGNVENATQKVTFDVEYTLVTPTHDKAYMRFDGWQSDAGNTISMTGIWSIDSNVTLTAKWCDTRTSFTISFVQAGQETKTYTVKEGESFTEIPVPVAKTGYIVEWDKKEFINVVENIVVTAVETAKTYTITLTTAEGELSQTTITVTYGQAYELPVPAHTNRDFVAWKYNDIEVAVKGVWNIDTDQETITLVAQWSEDRWTGFF